MCLHWTFFTRLLPHFKHRVTVIFFFLSTRSFQEQDQGSEERKYRPQGDPAEEEEDDESRTPEEEGPKESDVVLEKWCGLPLPAAGQPGKPVPNHGSQGGQSVPTHRNPQVGQDQQRVQEGYQEAQDLQVSCLFQCFQIKWCCPTPGCIHPTYGLAQALKSQTPLSIVLFIYLYIFVYLQIYFQMSIKIGLNVVSDDTTNYGLGFLVLRTERTLLLKSLAHWNHFRHRYVDILLHPFIPWVSGFCWKE